MRSRDIKTWVHRSTGPDGATDSPYDSDDDMNPDVAKSGGAGSSRASGGRLVVSNAHHDWDKFLPMIDQRLRTPSTKARLDVLRGSLVSLLDAQQDAATDGEKLSNDQRVQLLDVLVSTFNRFPDKESRVAAQDVAARLVVGDVAAGSSSSSSSASATPVLAHAVQWLRMECETTCKMTKDGVPRTALTSRANLAHWAFSIFAAYAALCDGGKTELTESPCWDTLVRSLAVAYDAVACDAQTRPSVAKNVTAAARRAVRKSYRAIPPLLQSLSAMQAPTSIPLLGLVIDVSLRLRAGSETVRGAPDGQGRAYVKEAKQTVLAAYVSQVVSSKSGLLPHTRAALDDFIAAEVSDDDVVQTIRPAMEKMMLRSPEVAMPTVASFFSAWKHDTAPHFAHVRPSVLSAAKSSSAVTRNQAVALFDVLAQRCLDQSVLSSSVKELLGSLKEGKASSPDHRAALYEMLAKMRAAQEYSVSIANDVTSLLCKETQESCMRTAMAAIKLHLPWCLRHDHDVSKTAGKALAKEFENTKVALRKIVCTSIGDVFWDLTAADVTDATKALAESLLPGWEISLKNASTSTLTSSSGPLEGYVAVAVIYARAWPWGATKVQAAAEKNAVLQGLHLTQPKPSFLLNEKVVRKAATADEEVWLLRALEAFVGHALSNIAGEEGIVAAVAMAEMQIAFAGKTSVARKTAVTTLSSISQAAPRLACKILNHGLTTWLMVRDAELKDPKGEGSSAHQDHSRALKDLLLAATALDPSIHDESVRQEILTELFVFSHHAELGSARRQCFLDLCSSAKVDPTTFVDARLHSLLSKARDALNVAQLREAALASLSTLTLVSPEETSGLLLADIDAVLKGSDVRALTPDDLGMWKMSPEALFVDVLAQKEEKNVDKNRKNASLDQWEAELRASIAKKRAAETKTLTKDQQKAVDAQREIEKEVRTRVTELQAQIRNALACITSLVESRSRAAIEHNMTPLIHMLLDLLAIPQAQVLVEAEVLGAIESLSSCCTERMGDYATLVRVALLRTINEAYTGANYEAETLGSLTLRILYRLHFLCEQTPLDLASVSFVEPLITRLISRGGLDVSPDDADTIEEQTRLALNFVAFHGNACRDARFPRLAFVNDLVKIVATQTQLAKDAVAALRTLGEAMKANATSEEMQQLLKHAVADEVYVRTGALQALQPLDLTDIEFCVELWVACHDDDEENARLANKAWEDNGLDIPATYASALLPLLEHSHAFVRTAAGKSLATAAEVHVETVADLARALMALYAKKNEVIEPQYDRFGLIIEKTLNWQDPWQARGAIALTFHNLAPIFSTDTLVPYFEFLIGKEGLGDRNEDVRRKMLDAAAAIIDMHGMEKLSELISMFESFLQHPAAGTNDDITEAVIILFGRLAKHLDAKDARVSQVVRRLIEALKTPSELVQVAVADCLAPLARSVNNDVPSLIEDLFAQLLHAPKYAERRGAAYGLAALIKGRGISSIAEFRVMTRLAEAVEEKKDAQARQGAVMAYETLIATLQQLFEPYVPQILPHLLTCFGDQSGDVREATQETSRVIMQNISGYGVRLIMPSLLAGLDEKQWRTKKGAIELLGAMAYCAPRQLSQFLPTIIPHLSEPIKDSHNQVRQAAERALKGFGDVISNPEVKQLVPVIMKALVDPNLKTSTAQKAILSQKWIHVLDGPSLALMIPVIDRGLRERGAQVQKDAARIVGNLSSLTDSKDFVPYLESLVPLIRAVLVSPVPDARATAAKSLGTLVERLGEIHFVNLVPSLLDVLKSDLSSVDRQGSAQGLAEVLAGLGVERMEALLPEVINNAQSSRRSTIRESHILLLIYLPATFGLRFSPYLGRIIPPILGGIADDSDTVRDASMRAGRMIIANYSNRAVDLLLPELEIGLFDDNWRIRLSSIQLVSDLLFRLSGITGSNEVENEADNADEEGGAEQNIVAGYTIQKSLAEALGADRRDKILAAFYLLRQDSVINVRQAAVQTWKAIVTNTPKLAREILPLLVDLIIQLLAQGVESRETAGRALGELVSKLGERILGESIPMLQSKTDDDDERLRAGVCTAVTEILNNSTEHQLQDHQDNLIAIVRKGLTDASREVREAAAEAFDALQDHLGAYAIDEIVPGLLETLVKEDDEDDEDDSEEEDVEDDSKDEADTAERGHERKDNELGGVKAGDEDGQGEEEDEGDDDDDDDDFVDDSEQGRALSALQEIMKGSANSVFPVLVPTLTVQPISPFNASALVTLGSLAGNALYKRCVESPPYGHVIEISR